MQCIGAVKELIREDEVYLREILYKKAHYFADLLHPKDPKPMTDKQRREVRSFCVVKFIRQCRRTHRVIEERKKKMGTTKEV